MPVYTEFPLKYIPWGRKHQTVICSPQQVHQQHTQSQQLPSQAASTSCTGTNKATNTEIPAPMEQMGVRLINPNSKNTPGKTSYHKSYLANPHTI